MALVSANLEVDEKDKRLAEQINLNAALQAELQDRDIQFRQVTDSLAVVVHQQTKDHQTLEEVREYLMQEKTNHRMTKAALRELQLKDSNNRIGPGINGERQPKEENPPDSDLLLRDQEAKFLKTSE